MNPSILKILIGLGIASTLKASALTHYVDVNGTNPVAPYATWATAATNIQDGLNVAFSSDTVMVTNGIYQYGGDSSSGSNRVHVLNTGVILQSVNGPGVTVIRGYQVPGTTNGSSAVRCVYLNANALLSGFTLTNGATPSGSGNGGGAYAGPGCVISNCIITGNAAAAGGGGVYGSVASPTTLDHCLISNNSDGGVIYCTVNNSLLTGNSGDNAAKFSTLNNCTLSGNTSSVLGAANGCALNNSIIYFNHNGSYADCYQCKLTNCCTTVGLGNATLANNCISNSPGFVNPAGGDFHLNSWSHCIDAGNNATAPGSTDLDGNPRIIGTSVDIGAYENQSPLSGTVHYVSLTSTNPVAPYTNWLTAATNIQDAVGVAQTGELVVADDGAYNIGNTVIFGAESNRVALTNGVTLTSAGGWQAATISGGASARCVYVGTNAVLNGFTLTGGFARNGGNVTNELSGGGAWCVASGVISNCLVTGNTAYSSGLAGGIYGGTAYNCTLTNNSSGSGGGAANATLYNCLVISNNSQSGNSVGGGLYSGTASNCTFSFNWAYAGGGGAYQSTLYNCAILTNRSSLGVGGVQASLLRNCTVEGNYGFNGGASAGTNYNCVFLGNTASAYGGGTYQCTDFNCLIVSNVATGGYGGGAYQGVLYNCTVCSNSAATAGGGLYNGTAYDSIIYYNAAATGSNLLSDTCFYCCTTPSAGLGCITNAPVFVDQANGNFRLLAGSPCINTGTNAYVSTSTDLDGNPRITGYAVDMGAYEKTPASILPTPWLAQYGLLNDGSADFTDADGDGMNNYAEWKAGTSPTDPASVLHLVSPTNTVAGVEVTWQSVGGIIYYLQRSSDLAAQPAFSSIHSNIMGQAVMTHFTDTGATGDGPYFYRVGVQ